MKKQIISLFLCSIVFSSLSFASGGSKTCVSDDGKFKITGRFSYDTLTQIKDDGSEDVKDIMESPFDIVEVSKRLMSEEKTCNSETQTYRRHLKVSLRTWLYSTGSRGHSPQSYYISVTCKEVFHWHPGLSCRK